MKSPEIKIVFRELCWLMTALVLLESMGPVKLKTSNPAEVFLQLGPQTEGRGKLLTLHNVPLIALVLMSSLNARN